jgi:predicted TIM-barrel fold metal-dependent hydrolase
MLDTLRVIDADTHVDETEDTWNFVQPGEEPYKPTTGFPRNQDPSRPPTRYWVVDGQRKPRRIRDDAKSGTKLEARELLDIDVRLRHMDELGTEVQVIYPTLLLSEPADHAEVELAITRSYNRWLADRCAKSKGRLRWVCVPPTRTMSEALATLRFAKDHGACGVLKKGDREGGHWPVDPYFFPLYEEAERLDMPICFHLGSGVPDHSSAREFSWGGWFHTQLPVIHGIHSLLMHEVPKQFPKLRWGAIEAGASWIPLVAYDLQRRKKTAFRANQRGPQFELADNIFAANNIYSTVQVDEDLKTLLPYIGEDNLLVGSDYTHQDQSQEHGFVQQLRQRAADGDITESAVRKMVYDNPKRFYGIE